MGLSPWFMLPRSSSKMRRVTTSHPFCSPSPPCGIREGSEWVRSRTNWGLRWRASHSFRTKTDNTARVKCLRLQLPVCFPPTPGSTAGRSTVPHTSCPCSCPSSSPNAAFRSSILIFKKHVFRKIYACLENKNLSWGWIWSKWQPKLYQEQTSMCCKLNHIEQWFPFLFPKVVKEGYVHIWKLTLNICKKALKINSEAAWTILNLA